MISFATLGQCDEVFISEYIEGTGVNRAIEIYNPTSDSINLSDYQLERYRDGITDLSQSFLTLSVQLQGWVAPNDVTVFVVDVQEPYGADLEFPGVFEELAALADFWLCPDLEENATMYFDGNDALVLRKVSTNQVVDVFGRIGEDPGLGGWDNQTQNVTLVRKFGIEKGDENGFDEFPVINEWDLLYWGSDADVVVDYLDILLGNLGLHHCSCNALFDSCEPVPSTAPSHPFISEYSEGTNSNKAIELFNPTDGTIDLSNYKIQRYADGSPFVTDELELSGELLSNETWVVVCADPSFVETIGFNEDGIPVLISTPAVDPSLVFLADQLGIGVLPSPLFFDGDDALVLLHTPSMTQVDIFGKIGQDPGTSWTDNAATGYVGLGNPLTENQTLRRKPHVYQGVQTNPTEFNATLEWFPVGLDHWSGLGNHSYCFNDLIFGCTQPEACNYNAIATENDDSCIIPGDPCNDDDATTLNDAYNEACECEGLSGLGCTDLFACNYDPDAVFDDGTCEFISCLGCTAFEACNFSSEATQSDGSCLFPGDPCDDGDATTSNDMYNDSCQCEGESAITGCINPNACNYSADATESDGSCLFPGDPCDDGDATTSNDMYDDSCQCEGESAITGCINPNACNYSADATESDGSCYFPGDPCDDGDESTTNDMYTDSCECQGDEPSQVSEDVLELALFPNPVHDWLSVRLEDGLAASLILFDPMGRVVQTWSTIGSARLDLSHLPPGPYVMSIHPRLGPARSERISILTWD